MRSLLVPALISCLAAGAAAQTTPFVFQVDPSGSNWTWAATANGIPLTPTSTDQFQMFGTFDSSLGFNLAGFASEGSVDGGEITIAPDLQGFIPLLATVRVEDLVLSPVADPLDFGDPLTSDGTFAADFVWHVLQGTAYIVPIFGSPSTVDLAGTSTAPAYVTGAVTVNPDGTLHLVSPQSMQLVLTDPDTGIVFVVDLDGVLTANEVRHIEAYCSGDGSATVCPCGNTGAAGAGCANSAGSGARLGHSGSSSLGGADLVLVGTGLVPGTPGLYFQGLNAVNAGQGTVLGDGLRCAGGGVVRVQVRMADAAGHSSTSADVGAVGGASPGDTRRYQLWYRDPVPGPCGQGFNLSNGLEVLWIP